MKVKNYENTSKIYILIVLLFIIEFCGTILLCTNKTYSYKKISGIVSNENTIVLMLNKQERKLLYQNQSAYINNKLEKYKIIEDKGKLFAKNKVNYYEIIINIKLQDKYKPNDLVEISVKNKRRISCCNMDRVSSYCSSCFYIWCDRRNN